jgi:hypothetical protein
MLEPKKLEGDAESVWERYKRIFFLIALFVTLFVSTRIVIRPINTSDFDTYSAAVKAVWRGQSPYVMDQYMMPPWAALVLAPLANQPLETWLALSVALFVTAIIAIGSPAGLLLLLHPIFITLIASSNPEWLLVGSGLWLLSDRPRGWRRGVAWLLLSCKPQSTIGLLIFDGWNALKTRDWWAFIVSGAVAITTLIIFPMPFQRLLIPHDWSSSILAHYGLIGAILVTIAILIIRRHQLADTHTLGILLTPVWVPYTLEYNYMAVIFTMRSAGWLRTSLYVGLSLGLMYLFWRDYHVAEQIGAAGMVLLAALLAPDYTKLPRKVEEPGALAVPDIA